MMKIEKYSFGIGDRFGKEGSAQLQALMEMQKLGIQVAPVWNKSNREHTIIGSDPGGVRDEAFAAVSLTGFKGSYYIDADHISLDTVDRFVESSNFFTIDVAHFIGKYPGEEAVRDFILRFGKFLGEMTIPGIEQKLSVTPDFLSSIASNYLVATGEVGRIYDHLCHKKGKGNFITEVSMDESELVQGPLELFFILAMLQEKGVEVQTLAPKFSGLFAKGIDYIGDISRFTTEFNQDVAMVKFTTGELGLSDNLKLSVHSGSDKFSLYPVIHSALRKSDAGIHVKTAGTTWLEEVAGLAESGKDGLEIAREIYARSWQRFDELTGPYSTVLCIDTRKLPDPLLVKKWTSIEFSRALTHDQACSYYNPHFRQLIHVGYKVAAEMGNEFTSALDRYHDNIAGKVTYNLLEKHLKPLFLG